MIDLFNRIIFITENISYNHMCGGDAPMSGYFGFMLFQKLPCEAMRQRLHKYTSFHYLNFIIRLQAAYVCMLEERKSWAESRLPYMKFSFSFDILKMWWIFRNVVMPLLQFLFFKLIHTSHFIHMQFLHTSHLWKVLVMFETWHSMIVFISFTHPAFHGCA